MVDKRLLQKIFGEIKRHPSSPGGYEDGFSYLLTVEREDFDLAHEKNRELRKRLVQAITRGKNVMPLFEVYRKTLLFDAKSDFDSYLLYMEIDRNPEDRFYQPRRERLKGLASSLQDLADDKLDELFLSEPPRVGKTSMLMFYSTWLIGRDSERSNLYSAYSDTITKAFYNGVLEIINDPVTYHWNDVFPDSKVVQTNAQEETINIDRRKRYPSLTCRSLYGTLNGACDCNGILISDDLIGGIEEALNPDRMIAAWSKVDNNLIPRAKEKAKLLWCGTRWSMIDPAGIRMDLLEHDDKFKNRRYRVINLPALDENDESNFDYAYGVGFSTEYYRQRRASFEKNNDMASWQAQYMGEPIEREGTVFRSEDFRYFTELPDNPDRKFMPIDPAWGGGDYVAAPVCYQFGDDIYIADVVFDNGEKNITQSLIAKMIQKHGISTVQIEATKMTEGYKDGIKAILDEKGIKCNIITRPAPTTKSKEQRIFDVAPDIREYMLFRDGNRSKAYDMFMQNVFSFKITGKNKHDDAPDSLAMAINMTIRRDRAEVFTRRF